jgi:hypothetical protein
VVPNPIDFIAMYFEQFGTSNDIGRRDYIRHTQDVNYTAAFQGCEIMGTTMCSMEIRWLVALMATIA